MPQVPCLLLLVFLVARRAVFLDHFTVTDGSKEPQQAHRP